MSGLKRIQLQYWALNDSEIFNNHCETCYGVRATSSAVGLYAAKNRVHHRQIKVRKCKSMGAAATVTGAECDMGALAEPCSLQCSCYNLQGRADETMGTTFKCLLRIRPTGKSRCR